MVCLMLYLIGWQSLTGVLFLIAMVPCILIMSFICARLREQTAVISDRRISTMNEIVSSIRTLKAHTWEDSFRENVK